MRSSGPQPTVGGKCEIDSFVISRPIIAKSPDSNSRMSGHPFRHGVCAPFACGSGPRRRKNIPNACLWASNCQISFRANRLRVSFSKTIHPGCERIIRFLQKERERQKISKYELAKRSGISQSMIGRVESGARIPTLDIVLKMADALGLNFAVIVERAERNSKSNNWG